MTATAQAAAAARKCYLIEFTPAMVTKFWELFRAGEPCADVIAPELGVDIRTLRRWMAAQDIPKGRVSLEARAALAQRARA